MVVLASCSADESRYSRYPCHFIFDMSIHNTSLLSTCTNPLSTDVFCFVWQQPVGEVRHIQMLLNDDKTTYDTPITAKIEADEACLLGVSNGIIVGCSSYYDGELLCYDRQCPHCLEEYVTKKLEWYKPEGKLNGQKVQCPRCHRVYDLVIGGVSSDGPPALLQYKAYCQGNLFRI